MPRRRLGVALLVPPPWATEIDGLRRACGDGQLGRVPAHCTLVPPVNVREADVPAALAIVRAAAARWAPRRRATAEADPTGRVGLRLGPPATFHPDSPTLHLPVDDADGAISALREAVFVGPLERVVTWPFVPHVTLADDIDERRAGAAIEALADFRISAAVDRIHVLEQQVDPEHGRRWVPVADALFRAPAVVGRGGIELELTTSSLVDPEVVALVPHPEELTRARPEGAQPIVITARRAGRAVGVLTGWTCRPDRAVDEQQVDECFVIEEHRGTGIGRQLRLAFEAIVHERSVLDEGARHETGDTRTGEP